MSASQSSACVLPDPIHTTARSAGPIQGQATYIHGYREFCRFRCLGLPVIVARSALSHPVAFMDAVVVFFDMYSNM